RRVPLARVAAARARPPPPRRGDGRHGPRRDREARGGARGGDVRGGRGAALRVRGQAARRDQGAAPRPRGHCERLDAPPSGVRPLLAGRRKPAAGRRMLPGMRQIDRLLDPNEHVHLVSREHGVVLVWPFLRAAMILALACAAAIAAAGLDLPAAIRLVPVLAAAAAGLGALLRVVRVVSRWQRRVLVVTDRRALLLAGGLGS